MKTTKSIFLSESDAAHIGEITKYIKISVSKSYFFKKNLVLLGRGEKKQSKRRVEWVGGLAGRQTDRQSNSEQWLFVSLISLFVCTSFIRMSQGRPSSTNTMSPARPLLGGSDPLALGCITSNAGILFPALNASPARLPRLTSRKRLQYITGLQSSGFP